MNTSTPSASPRRPLPAAARILLGLVLLVFGLNGFLQFMPGSSMPAAAGALLGAFAQSGYMLRLIFGTQVLVGVLLLANRFVPLALLLIAPVIVHIICFHLCLAPSSIGPALVVLLLEIYLAWAHRAAFRPALGARNVPA